MEGENANLLQTIKPFLKFEKSFDITTIHNLFGKDLDMASLHLQYMDLSNSAEEVKCQPLHQVVKYLSESSRVQYLAKF